MRLYTGVIFLFLLSYVYAEFKLRGSKAFYIYPQTEHDLSTLKDIYEKTKIPGLHVWQYPYDSDVRGIFFVPRNSLKTFKKLMNKNSISYEVFLGNVEKALKDDVHRNKISKKNRQVKINLKSYYSHSGMEDYMADLVRKYPKQLSVEEFDKTWESRRLRYAKVSTSFWLDKKKPIIIVDGGRVARNWMTSSIALYSMSKLIEDITESDLADKADWIIMPSANPDGLEYSKTTDKNWLKSRTHTGDSNCLGVYIDRNYGIGWINQTSDKCNSLYQGQKPFSETETLVLKDMLERNADRVKGYLTSSISKGGEIAYPFCYCRMDALNKQELVDLGTKMVTAINSVNKGNYELQHMCHDRENWGSGAAVDYATLFGKVPLVYTVNLRKFGDDINFPPETSIELAVKETWNAFVVFERYVIDKYYGKM